MWQAIEVAVPGLVTLPKLLRMLCLPLGRLSRVEQAGKRTAYLSAGSAKWSRLVR